MNLDLLPGMQEWLEQRPPFTHKGKYYSRRGDCWHYVYINKLCHEVLHTKRKSPRFDFYKPVPEWADWEERLVAVATDDDEW